MWSPLLIGTIIVAVVIVIVIIISASVGGDKPSKVIDTIESFPKGIYDDPNGHRLVFKNIARSSQTLHATLYGLQKGTWAKLKTFGTLTWGDESVDRNGYPVIQLWGKHGFGISIRMMQRRCFAVSEIGRKKLGISGQYAWKWSPKPAIPPAKAKMVPIENAYGM